MPSNKRWPLERVLFALAGTMTLLSALLAATSPAWFLLLTAFVGVNQWLYVLVGNVPGIDRAAPRLPPALRDLPAPRARGAGSRGGYGLMAITEPGPRLGRRKVAEEYPHAVNVGPIGRLGRYTATHFRVVLAGWVVLALVLGFFAPRVETALSGAGWETSGSQSVQARQLINQNFHGLSSYGLMTVVYSPTQTVDDPGFRRCDRERRAHAEGRLRRQERRRAVARRLDLAATGTPRSCRRARRKSSNGMVKAAETLKGKLAALSASGVQVHLTGASGMWSDFNTANRNAMMKSEVISWPVTLGILLLAFGSLVAAGLPLMLTMVGLACGRAGSLYLGTLVMPISIWAMNFALMFALALGIDYALFVVHRFRGAFFGHGSQRADATAVTMDTAGKAVLFSGITVLISLCAVMLVPSPAFRSMSLGIMLAVSSCSRRR